MTILSTKIIRELNSRFGDSIYNTSYPLRPDDWKQYLKDGALTFNFSEPIAFYLHVPFCKQLCSFCEYSRMMLPPLQKQILYLETLRDDILNFIKVSPAIKLYGFDIGGGTPSALENTAFETLLEIYGEVVARVKHTQDFEPSIEATFETLTENKCRIIASAGIKRISLGLQSSSSDVLAPLKRHSAKILNMAEVIDNAHKAGIQKINIDLMYGLPEQSLESVKKDMRTIKQLQPEQVTLYEFRTNQLKKDYQIDFELCYQQYCLLFEELTGLGYFGIFGQNTFSRASHDKGLSSYLRHRMFEGAQYKGFGISAQSMSEKGISYNKGKNQTGLERLLDENTFESENHYALPSREVFSKFIAISGYSGGFSLDVARRLYGDRFDNEFYHIIETLKDNKLIEIKGDMLRLTRKGFKYYGPILSIFYAPPKAQML